MEEGTQQQAENGLALEAELWDALDKIVQAGLQEEARLLAWAAGMINWRVKQ
jgi:hypothetical protein